MLLSKLLPALIFFQIGMAAHTFTAIFTLHIAFSPSFCYQNCYPAKKMVRPPFPSYQNCYPILCLPCVYMEIPRLTYAIYGVIGLILLSKLLPTAKRFRQHDINCCQKCYPNKIPSAKRGFIKTVTPKSHYSREFPCLFPRPKKQAFASKWKLSEQANVCRIATTKTPSFQTNSKSSHVFFAKQKMRAFASKWKISEQDNIHRLATTKILSFQTNSESSHAFFQGQKCEPSRANGKSLSKTTYIGLPPPKYYHSKPISRVSMPFSKAKKASLREQMENP